MIDFLLSRANQSIVKYRTEDIAAANFFDETALLGRSTNVTARAMFQTIPLHSAGIAVNLMDNAILRTVTGLEDVRIDAVNQPLPKSTLVC